MKICVLAHIGSGYHAIAASCGFALVDKPEDADCVMFTGGEDISPALYGEKPHPFTGVPDVRRDEEEQRIFNHCVETNKPMLGICRGSQFLCAMSGGKLHQHVEGHALRTGHAITTVDEREFFVTSTHHQMMDINGSPLALPLAWREGEGSVFDFDPEVVWFRDTKCLAVQYHPEYMPEDSEGYIYFTSLVKQYIMEGV